MVQGVSHDDAPVSIDCNAATREGEMSVALAVAANCANMGAVAVAQHLHAAMKLVNNNNVTSGIKRDTRGTLQLVGACSFAADGAEMRAVAVAQNLNTMVVSISNNKVAFVVKRNTTIASFELSVAAAPAADGADVGAVAQPMHLHTSVFTVKYSNVALAVNGNALGRAESSVA